jgi:hypothetical protein
MQKQYTIFPRKKKGAISPAPRCRRKAAFGFRFVREIGIGKRKE